MNEKRTDHQALLCGGRRGAGQRFNHNAGGLRALAVWIGLVLYQLMYFKCQANDWLGCQAGGRDLRRRERNGNALVPTLGRNAGADGTTKPRTAKLPQGHLPDQLMRSRADRPMVSLAQPEGKFRQLKDRSVALTKNQEN
jgi:hypothetical protein